MARDWKPFSSSYYAQGNLAGVELTFLMDSGCSTNLVANCIWERLSWEVQATTRTQEGRGVETDVSEMGLQGVMELTDQI